MSTGARCSAGRGRRKPSPSNTRSGDQRCSLTSAQAPVPRAAPAETNQVSKRRQQPGSATAALFTSGGLSKATSARSKTHRNLEWARKDLRKDQERINETLDSEALLEVSPVAVARPRRAMRLFAEHWTELERFERGNLALVCDYCGARQDLEASPNFHWQSRTRAAHATTSPHASGRRVSYVVEDFCSEKCERRHDAVMKELGVVEYCHDAGSTTSAGYA